MMDDHNKKPGAMMRPVLPQGAAAAVDALVKNERQAKERFVEARAAFADLRALPMPTADDSAVVYRDRTIMALLTMCRVLGKIEVILAARERLPDYVPDSEKMSHGGGAGR